MTAPSAPDPRREPFPTTHMDGTVALHDDDCGQCRYVRSLSPPQPHAQQGREPVTPSTEAEYVARLTSAAGTLLIHAEHAPCAGLSVATDVLRRVLDDREAADRAPGPLDVERLQRDLAEELHNAMCDVSHHDRGRRCAQWGKYPNVAASVAPRLAARLATAEGEPRE